MSCRRAAKVACSSLFPFAIMFACVPLSVTGCGGSASPGGTGGRTGAGGGVGRADTGMGGAVVDAGPIFPSCTPTTVVDPLVLDFSTFDAPSNQARFGVFGTTFAGGTYQYPAAIMSSFVGGNWHMTGTVADYSGFGLYLSCKSNVAGFTGLQMDISGTFTSNLVDDGGAAPARVTMGISQPADQLDTAHSTEVTWGTCAANCNAPGLNIPLTAITTTVTLPWTSFVGGTPVGQLDPAGITGIFFTFPWDGASTAQYAVDVTIDNVRFTGGTAPPPADGGKGGDAATTD